VRADYRRVPPGRPELLRCQPAWLSCTAGMARAGDEALQRGRARSPVDTGRASRMICYALAVTPLEQVLRSRLEAFRAEHLEAEGVGEPVGRVERSADRQRVLDLLA
jgi:hypothetical protein